MAFAFCRIQKLHASNLKASAQHSQRQRSTPNADPKKEHVCILGTADRQLDVLVRERIGRQTIRKNAVLAVEILLSASPEYFRPQDPSKAGYWQEDRLNDFTAASKDWLVEEYGDRIVRAHLHLDEATPHIHAYLVPLDEKGKLNCRGLFGDREKLRHLQDSYAQAMKRLELERGIKGSRATYTQVKEYYNAVTQSPDLTLEAAGIHHQLADRRRILKENIQTKRTVKALSGELEAKEERLVLLEVEQEALKSQIQHWQGKYQNMVGEKKLSLQQVAWELGLVQVKNQDGQWRNHEQVLQITDTSFSLSPNTTSSNNSSSKVASSEPDTPLNKSNSALDLVMLVNGCSFQQAVLWLNDRHGEQAATQAVNSHTKESIKKAPTFQFTPPKADKDAWQKVRSSLTDELKITPALVDKLHREGLIYADKNQNLICSRRNLIDGTLNGAILSGATLAGRKSLNLAPTSKRSEGWFYFESGGGLEVEASLDTAPLVLVDSPLDALAKATLDNSPHKTRYLCLWGGKQPPLEFLRSQKRGTLTIALNQDSNSQAMAHQLRQRLSSRNIFNPPKNLDWVSELQSVSQAKEQNMALNLEQLEQIEELKLFPSLGRGLG